MKLDKEQISLLWDKLTPKLYGYLVNVLKDKELAQDVLQTTWLKAIDALPKFEEKRGATFSSWLFAIAINECKQNWRKQGREITFDAELHDKEDFDPKDTDRIFVEQVINRLPPDYREIMRLHYISDLKIKDISRILGMNPVTIRVRLHRVVALARKMYEKYE